MSHAADIGEELQLEIVKLLIMKGADINIVDNVRSYSRTNYTYSTLKSTSRRIATNMRYDLSVHLTCRKG